MKSLSSVNTVKFMDEEIIIFMDDEMNPWFVGNQLLKVMEYSDANHTTRTLERNVDEEDYIKMNRSEVVSLIENLQIARSGDLLTLGTQGIVENIWNGKNATNRFFINESGMYALIFGSKKKKAREFKNWVTKDILPSIRKNGYYQMTHDSNNELMNQLQDQINSLQEEITKVTEENKILKEQRDSIQQEHDEFQREVAQNIDNTFYSHKVYFSNDNPIKTYTTKVVADRLGIQWNVLDNILSERGMHHFNPSYFVCKTKFANTKFLIDENVIDRGYAVWMPWTEQDKFPGWYYQRWTVQGLELIRQIVDWEKQNNPNRFKVLNPFEVKNPFKG